ncbi:hypothetical protein BGX21_002506 [Mortierella sp. AD011]|nr:hypothetical protein BGX20_004863 [Mortierella sp. AD010]KAF9401169.1 hypothetical protein BGX21_002506 [Mortierella sp. AD011]
MQSTSNGKSTSRNPNGSYESSGSMFDEAFGRQRDEIAALVTFSVKEQLEDMEARLQEKYDGINQRILEYVRYQAAPQQPVDATMVKHALKVLRENHEFHECPIPRLFIVLPKYPELREVLNRPLLNQLRLHFLCECGAHTADKGGHPLDMIHMTTHRGYDLTNPSEFFHKYGTYILAVMRIVRDWADKESLFNLPPGAFDYESNDVREYFDGTKKNFFILMDQTISCIEQHMSRAEEGAGSLSKEANFEALTRDELLQLRPYLREEDQSHTLGGLHRVFAADRYVKWGCAKHVTETGEFRLITTRTSGQVIAEDHKVIITISSPAEAREFYITLNGESRIRELDIKLDWDATKRELQQFKDAIRNSKVVVLTLDGARFDRPLLDMINHSSRFDPIMELVFHSRMLSVKLKNFNAFRRARDSTVRATTQPNFLSSGSPDGAANNQRQFGSLFKIRPRRLDLLRTVEALSKRHVTETLQEITMEDSFNSVYFKLNHGRVEAVEAEVNLSANSVENVLQYIATGSLTKLTLTADSTPSVQWLKGNLIGLLTTNPRLVELLVRSNSIEALELLDNVINDEFSSECKGVFRKFQMRVAASDVVTSVAEFPKDSKPRNISTYVSQKSTNLEDFFKKYGSTIKTLETNAAFTNAYAEGLVEANLTSLTLNPESLDDTGLGFMEGVIQRSKLTHLCFDFNNLHDDTQLPKAKSLLSSHKDQLTGFSLGGTGNVVGRWIREIKEVIPDRKETPRLENFALNCSPQLPHDPVITDWIAKIISTPVQPSTSEISQSSTNTSRNLKSASFRTSLILNPEREAVVGALLSYMPEMLNLDGPGTEEAQLKKLVNKSFGLSSLEREPNPQGFVSIAGASGTRRQRRQREQDLIKVEIPEHAILSSSLDPGDDYSTNFNAASSSKGKHRK